MMIMGNKTCNKCGREGLGWNIKYHTESGKWMLDSHKDKNDAWCIKPFVKSFKKFYTGSKKDYVKCDLCKGNCGFCYVDDFFDRHPEVHGTTLSEHIEKYHPNGEPRDEVDSMVISEEEKKYQRKIRGW